MTRKAARQRKVTRREAARQAAERREVERWRAELRRAVRREAARRLAEMGEAELQEAALKEVMRRVMSELREAARPTILTARREAKRQEIMAAVMAAEGEVGERHMSDWWEAAERRAALKARSILALHFDGLDRYHGAAALVMAAGSLGMILAAGLALAPLWVGFLAGALPTFLLAALVYPEHA